LILLIAKKEDEMNDIFSSISFNTIILFLQYEEIEDKIIKILEEYIKFVSIEVIVDQYEVTYLWWNLYIITFEVFIININILIFNIF